MLPVGRGGSGPHEDNLLDLDDARRDLKIEAKVFHVGEEGKGSVRARGLPNEPDGRREA